MAENFHLIDLDSEKDLIALDQRLNQNLFVGLAANPHQRRRRGRTT